MTVGEKTIPLLTLQGGLIGNIILNEKVVERIEQEQPRIGLGWEISSESPYELLSFTLVVDPSWLDEDPNDIVKVERAKEARSEVIEENRLMACTWEGDVVDLTQNPTMFVALSLPEYDGSGQTKLLGVFSIRAEAEASLYREINQNGSWSPNEIIECQLNRTVK